MRRDNFSLRSFPQYKTLSMWNQQSEADPLELRAEIY